jgi:hypothetical protein
MTSVGKVSGPGDQTSMPWIAFNEIKTGEPGPGSREDGHDMRGVTIAALTVAGVLAFGAVAQAGSINGRERRQAHRIADGVQSGELTRRETRRLVAEQAWIRHEEARYRRSSGGIGPREYLDLQRDLNRASRHIYRQKHDAQRR